MSYPQAVYDEKSEQPSSAQLFVLPSGNKIGRAVSDGKDHLMGALPP
jgi:hypothetical protein